MYLFLTRIEPDVTSDEIANMVRKLLGTTDVVVFNLTPRERDPSTLSFISFKVGVSASLRDTALSSDTWPQDLHFREFTDRRPYPRLNLRPNFRLHPTPPESPNNVAIGDPSDGYLPPPSPFTDYATRLQTPGIFQHGY
uniref:Uncharacterized protein n=1 Tax=Anopheles atroparvus TaxID=41427 RepID=A0A182JAY4_ANOAO